MAKPHRFRPLGTLARALALSALPCAALLAREADVQSCEDIFQRRQAEANEAPDAAAELLRLGDWCLQVAERLSSEARARFRQRAWDCARRGESRAAAALRQHFDHAVAAIANAESLSAARALREAGERGAGELLENWQVQFREPLDFEDCLREREEGSRRLEEAAVPHEERDRRRRVGGGEIFLGGSWSALDLERPEIGYRGRVPLSEIVRQPRDFDGALLSTEFIGGGRLFALVDLELFDGFDDAGAYLTPNWMPDRLVLGFPRQRSGWRDRLEALRRAAPAAEAGGGRSGFHFRALVKVRGVERQSCRFCLGELWQLAVFDPAGKLLELLVEEEGGRR